MHGKCICNTSWYARHAWASDTLCRSSQEKLGSQLSFHDTLRLCCCHALLDPLGLQDVLWSSTSPLLGQSWPCCFPRLPDPTTLTPLNSIQKPFSSSTTLLHGCHGLLPVCLCSCHCGAPCWVTSRSDELQSLDNTVPLWTTFSYSVVAFSIWGGGFLFQWGIMDYSGGYVVHLASGTARFTAAYWAGPRLKEDRKEFPPKNLQLALAGAGILWMGWTGFNGGDPFAGNVDSSLAVLNTHICAATSLLAWICWDVIFFKKPSVIGAIQGMITGLVCITPAAGLVQRWATLIMGIASGSIPWYTMMRLSNKLPLLQKVDDTLGVLHTHAVAGTLGGDLTGLLAHPSLSSMFLSVPHSKGVFYGSQGGLQFLKQLVGAIFVIGWNVVVTSIILLIIKLITPLRMTEEGLKMGDAAVHGEEPYSLAGQGQREKSMQNHGNNNSVEMHHSHV